MMIIFYSIPVLAIIVILVLFICFGALVIQNIATLAVFVLLFLVWIIHLAGTFDEYGMFSSGKGFLSGVLDILFLVLSSFLMIKYVKLSGKNGAVGFFIAALIIYLACTLAVFFTCRIMQEPGWAFIAVTVSLIIILFLSAWSNGYTNVSENDYVIDNIDYIVTNSNYDDEDYNLHDEVLLFEYELSENGEYYPKPYSEYNSLEMDSDINDKRDAIKKIVADSIKIENGTVLNPGNAECYSYDIYNKKYRYVPVEYNGETYALFYYTKSSGYDVKFYFKETYETDRFGDKLYKTLPFTYSHKL